MVDASPSPPAFVIYEAQTRTGSDGRNAVHRIQRAVVNGAFPSPVQPFRLGSCAESQEKVLLKK